MTEPYPLVVGSLVFQPDLKAFADGPEVWTLGSFVLHRIPTGGEQFYCKNVRVPLGVIADTAENALREMAARMQRQLTAETAAFLAWEADVWAGIAMLEGFETSEETP